MHNTLVFATFPLHSSVFYHSTERFVKFGAVLHHDISEFFLEDVSLMKIKKRSIFVLGVHVDVFSRVGRPITNGYHCLSLWVNTYIIIF